MVNDSGTYSDTWSRLYEIDTTTLDSNAYQSVSGNETKEGKRLRLFIELQFAKTTWFVPVKVNPKKNRIRNKPIVRIRNQLNKQRDERHESD